MRNGTVVIFGAGATKACGGPLTAEILPRAFANWGLIEREDFMAELEIFLTDNFHLPAEPTARQDKESYPALPLLIGLIDIALDRGHSFGRKWDTTRLAFVRRALDYVIFAVLEHDLHLHRITNHYRVLLDKLHQREQGSLRVISLNYDIIADNTVIELAERSRGFAFPDYGCDIATDTYRQAPQHGALYKLHGSLNWLYCPACARLDIGTTESGRRTVKVLNELYQEEQRVSLTDGGGDLRQRYSCHGSPCRDCGTEVTPVMISPTYLKDYRNPHIAQVWYRAERALRSAERAVIVGYSMPSDDADVIYLLKRGLGELPGSAISVVEFDPAARPAREHDVGRNYCKLFGDDIDWHPEGFEAFAERFV